MVNCQTLKIMEIPSLVSSPAKEIKKIQPNGKTKEDRKKPKRKKKKKKSSLYRKHKIIVRGIFSNISKITINRKGLK